MKVSKDTTVAGATLFVKITGARMEKAPGEKRKPKEKPTVAEVMELNQKYSELNLAMILNHNFMPGDYHLVLTYSGDEPTVEDAKRHLGKLKRDLPALYRKEGILLKWVMVTEYKNQRIHHHVVCTGGVDMAGINKIWKHGFVRPAFLDDTRDYRKLAAYLIKETSKTFRDPDGVSRRRYTCSRTVEKPETRRELVAASNLFEDPKPLPGYYIDRDSVHKGMNPFTERPYVEYVMVSLTEEPRIKKWRRGKRVRNSQAAYNAWLRENGHEQLELIL